MTDLKRNIKSNSGTNTNLTVEERKRYNLADVLLDFKNSQYVHYEDGDDNFNITGIRLDAIAKIYHDDLPNNLPNNLPNSVPNDISTDKNDPLLLQITLEVDYDDTFFKTVECHGHKCRRHFSDKLERPEHCVDCFEQYEYAEIDVDYDALHCGGYKCRIHYDDFVDYTDENYGKNTHCLSCYGEIDEDEIMEYNLQHIYKFNGDTSLEDVFDHVIKWRVLKSESDFVQDFDKDDDDGDNGFDTIKSLFYPSDE